MDLDRFLGRAQFAGNLFVQEASNDQREDLAFAWRQRLIAQLQLEQLLGRAAWRFGNVRCLARWRRAIADCRTAW